MTPRPKRILRRTFLFAAVFLALFVATFRPVAGYMVARIALTTGANGPETPATFGVPFDRVRIPSGPRQLDSYVVTADPSCLDAPVLLIFHGTQETISNWARTQQFLFTHCTSSVIFDPTGSGDSSRPARFAAMEKDSVAAYTFTANRFPGSHIYVLGHSMGNGPMLEALPHFASPPAGVIVANAFASMRAYCGANSHNPFFRAFAHALPDWWNNIRAVGKLGTPVLVIHSDTDAVNPIAGARAIFSAANQPKTLTVLHGYRHNTLYQNPSDAWWSDVLLFLHAPK